MWKRSRRKGDCSVILQHDRNDQILTIFFAEAKQRRGIFCTGVTEKYDSLRVFLENDKDICDLLLI